MTTDTLMTLANAAWHDAETCAYQAPDVLPEEHVPLEAATGRILAADLAARNPLPSLTASAMDGWAVAGTGPWQVVAGIQPGSPPAAALMPGTAVEIATGAAIPAGATTVVRQEHGSVTQGVLQSRQPYPPPGADMRIEGEELQHGTPFAYRGSAVTPPLAGLAAAAGHDHLPIRRQPVVDVFILGDELLTTGPARGGMIRDALGVQLPAWVEWCGGRLGSLRFIPDRLDATVAAFSMPTADIVVTTGGSSVGKRDHVRSAIDATGGRIVVDQVAVRPGHPMLLARQSTGTWHVGLPGNPGAAIAAVLTLLRPLAAGMLGATTQRRTSMLAAADMPGGPVHRIAPASAVDGRMLPGTGGGSANLTGWASASHAVVVPPDGVRTGQSIDALRLPFH